MPVIVIRCSGAYFAPMLAALLRLLTVAALTLMPFGMGAANASGTRHAPTMAGAGHCDEQDGQPIEKSRDLLAGCPAGCSMFIAELARPEEPTSLLGQVADFPPVERWTSLPAETATPPPKIA